MSVKVPALRKHEIDPWLQQSEIMTGTIQQVCKDCIMANLPLSLPATAINDISTLQALLHAALESNMHQHHLIQGLLYRVDINEKQLRAILTTSEINIAQLSLLIIWRAAQKVIIRKHWHDIQI